MATPRMDITSFVGKLLEQDDVDALREGVKVLAQAVMETEVSGQIDAAPYERSSERIAYRNGYRTRRWVDRPLRPDGEHAYRPECARGSSPTEPRWSGSRPRLSPLPGSSAFPAWSVSGTDSPCWTTSAFSTSATSSGARGSDPISRGSISPSSVTIGESQSTIGASSTAARVSTSLVCSSSTRCRRGSSEASGGMLTTWSRPSQPGRTETDPAKW
jgi:Transposase, Mutator family